MQGSWCEMLALGLAQCSETLSLNTILSAITTQLAENLKGNKLPLDKYKEVSIEK